jgi:hypothetical protein
VSYDLYVVYSYLNYYKLGVEKDRDSTVSIFTTIMHDLLQCIYMKKNIYVGNSDFGFQKISTSFLKTNKQ